MKVSDLKPSTYTPFSEKRRVDYKPLNAQFYDGRYDFILKWVLKIALSSTLWPSED